MSECTIPRIEWDKMLLGPKNEEDTTRFCELLKKKGLKFASGNGLSISELCDFIEKTTPDITPKHEYVNTHDKQKRLEFWKEAFELAKIKFEVVHAHATVGKEFDDLTIDEQIEIYKHLTMGCLGEIEGEVILEADEEL